MYGFEKLYGNPDGGGGIEERSEAYYILKASQEHQLLRR